MPAALVLAAQDEAEFAGMLAHAMEHVVLRHGIRHANKAAMVNAGSIPLIFVGGWGGGCSDGLSAPIAFIAYQQAAELDADLWAVQTMARAGFDPQALVRYIQRVQPQSVGIAKKYSPLPDRDTRVASIRSAIETLPSIGDHPTQPNRFAAAQEEVRRFAQPPLVRSGTPPTLFRKEP